MIKKIEVSAPGKIILSGEHSVVYGYPAILAAVNKRLSIQLEGRRRSIGMINIKRLASYDVDYLKNFLAKLLGSTPQISIESKIPIGCGMGSSAAFATAFSAILMKLANQDWDLEKINEMAYQMEKKHHGNPSGGDNTISTYGGFLWYRKESEKLKIFSRIDYQKRQSKLFLINTGKPKESTKDMVSVVALHYRKNKRKVEKTLMEMERVTRGFLRFLLGEKSASLKLLLNENEKLLESLGVVSASTRETIKEIRKIGGAAKISGAGGMRTNSGILIAYHNDPAKLLTYAKKKNLDIIDFRLGEEGVKIEAEN